MIETVLQLLLTGLELWNHIESTKYMTKVADLKAQYYAENNKPPGARNDALLDNIRFQLFNLADAFTAEVAASKVKT